MTVRELRSLLVAIRQSPCKTPFNCPEHMFEEGKDHSLRISVTNGECECTVESNGKAANERGKTPKKSSKGTPSRPQKQHKEPKKDDTANGKDAPPTEDETKTEAEDETKTEADDETKNEAKAEGEEAGTEVIVVDGAVTTEEVAEDLQNQALAIWKHMSTAIAELYDLPVRSGRLHFIEKSGVLELQDDSQCTTSAHVLTQDDDNLSGRFAEFYVTESAAEVDLKKCVMDEPDCGPPDYRAPMHSIILYKAHERFPEADPGALVTLVNARMKEGAAENERLAYCCIRCWHEMSSAEHVSHCSRRETPTLSSMQPQTFQAIVPAEAQEKKRFPMGLNPNMNKPYAFAYDIKISPYKSPVPAPDKPEKQPLTKVRPLTALESSPEWVGRLAQLTDQTKRDEPLRVSQGCKQKPPAHPRLRLIASQEGPLRRVRNHYGKPPFDIAKLDHKRKRQLHRPGTVYSSRFSVEERFDNI